MPSTQSNPTIERLLDSAQDVFAEKGFRDATIKEICKQANANIASVNYHFGSKEKLYTRAWRKAFEESLKKHPPDGGVSNDAPPEERLRGRIKSLIHRIADQESQEFRFAQKEMANPTPLGKEVMTECIEPLVEETMDLLRELLGPDATEKTVEYCKRSIVSQCFHIMHIHKKQRIFSEAETGAFIPEIQDVDHYAEHVYQFSIAGIREMNNNESTSSPPK